MWICPFVKNFAPTKRLRNFIRLPRVTPAYLPRTGQTIGGFVRYGARWQSDKEKFKHARPALLTTVLWRTAHDRGKLFCSTDDFNSRHRHPEFRQSSERSPLGAIFTNMGSNWPSTVTRSFCAAITCGYFCRPSALRRDRRKSASRLAAWGNGSGLSNWISHLQISGSLCDLRRAMRSSTIPRCPCRS